MVLSKPGPDWIMRVASHRRHGGGHLTRSMLVAVALKSAGVEVAMVFDADSPEAHLKASLLDIHSSSIDENIPHPRFGCVLDGYEIISSEFKRWRRQAPFVAVLDDFLAPPGEADLVINGAVHLSGDSVSRVPALLGPNYALVNPELVRLPQRDRTKPIKQVVITYGKLDPDNLTGLTLQALEGIGESFDLTIVASAQWAHLAKLREQVAGFAGNPKLVLDVPDMKELLSEADLVIGAGGVSLLERMAAGVPSITLSIADNQDVFVKGAVELGGTISGGKGSSVGIEDLRQVLSDTFDDGNGRARSAAAGRELVDGRGPERIASHLISVTTERPLTPAS